SLSAERSAAFNAFLLIFTSKLRSFGGNATPPPFHWGARVVPWRARPGPCWPHVFERPPETRPRLFAPRVAWRASFISARTASCTRCGLVSLPNTPSSSATSPLPPTIGAFGAATTGDPPGDDFASLACETQAVQGRREHS